MEWYRKNTILRVVQEMTYRDPNSLLRHVRHNEDFATVLDRVNFAKDQPQQFSEKDWSNLEAIVDVTRPVLLVKDGKVEPPESALWHDRISASIESIHKNILSVGRIEVDGHPDAALMPLGEEFYVGTGWVVAPNIVLTNRHVALEFCNPDGTLKPGMVARIDFVEELGADPDNEYKILGALEIGSDFDYAFLAIGDRAGLPQPLQLAKSRDDLTGAYPLVYAVGYPAYDSRNPDKIQRAIFDNSFNIKYLSPGRLTKVEKEISEVGEPQQEATLEFDYSTLGGNSGSPVFDLSSGLVIGIHFSGAYRVANYAVPIWRLSERISRHTEKLVNLHRSQIMPQDTSSKSSTAKDPLFTLLCEKALYMSVGRARKLASQGFNHSSFSDTLDASVAAVVLYFFGDINLYKRVVGHLKGISSDFNQVFPDPVDRSEAVKTAPFPLVIDVSVNPPMQSMLESINDGGANGGGNGKCIAGVISGAIDKGLAGAGTGAAIGIVVPVIGPLGGATLGGTLGAIGGALGGAMAGGCFDSPGGLVDRGGNELVSSRTNEEASGEGGRSSDTRVFL